MSASIPPTPFSWVTIVWLVIAAKCITLAAVHVLVWWGRRAARANLLFAATAMATTLLALGELQMMRAATPDQFATAVRWSHVAAWLLIMALVGFVRLYLRAGRPTLAWAVCGIRTLALVLNFSTGVNLNYQQVTAVRRIPFLGEPISVGVGVPNPWMLVGQLSLVLLVIFVAEATVTVWRRGDRRLALVVGGGILFCCLFGAVHSILVFWNLVSAPIMASWFYMGIVIAMGLELSRDMIRAAELVDQLSRSEQQRVLAAEAAALLRQEIAHVGRAAILNQLASAVAHEINQPLAAILRNAEAAELFLQKESPDLDEIRVILEDVCSDIQRAGAVIDRMRAMLQRRPLETRMLRVAELIREGATLMRTDAAARQIRLEVRVPMDLPPVVADRVHVQQVLLNLILNGMDAMDGVTGEQRVLTMSAQIAPTEVVEIAVRDEGSGVPDAQLAQVFDPYFTTKPDGLGMGLSVSRAIIEAHGGRLWAQNNVGSGATFRFTLPKGVNGTSA